eukprot:gene52640-70374_t
MRNSAYKDRADENSMTLMEMENNQKWDALAEQEVKNQNSMLDSMGRSFGSASNLFRSTISKMGALVSGGGGSKHMYLLIVFVVL